jgi:ribosomal protein S18 acetylase RimI-like enzyme
MQNITMRRATIQDSDLIIEAIIAAEKSNSDLLSYAAIFNISEEEVADLLKRALDEEIEGQEICASHFLIAEIDGKPAATCASWIEAKNSVSSGQLKANILFQLLGKEAWDRAAERLKAVSETNIERSEGAAQIESVYTKTEFRGRKLTSMLIDQHFRLHKEEKFAPTKAQVILLKNNTSAANAYRKLGFEEVVERAGTSPLLQSLLPYPVKIMMEKRL